MIDRYRKLLTIPAQDKKVVLLQSGGLDSCYMAGLLNYCGFKGDNVHYLFIDYGQNSRVQEEKAAKAIAYQYSANFIKASFSAPWLQDSIIVGDKVVGDPDVPQEMGCVAAGTYVDMRNHMFLSMAASLAESLGIRYIAAGLDGHQKRFSGKPLSSAPDKHIKFIKAIEESLNEGSVTRHVAGTDFVLITPLVEGCKEATIQSANEMRLDLSKSWTCYNSGDKPCGTCCACVDRMIHFYNVGIYDPAFTKEEVEKYLELNA